MLEYAKPYTKEESLASLNPTVRRWFQKRYKILTPPQYYSFRLIKEQRNLIITAPTGSGKTFSAFMAILSELMDMSERNELDEKVYCLYISPLRALNNDIYRNVSVPLQEMYSKEHEGRKITIGIRTGDTPQSERQKQLRNPPNILVTTPETLAIVLNSQKFVENLRDVKFVIIDEIHELANNKRGVHLSLSLERLSEFVGHDFVRIGMGATLHPLDEAAKFLVGYENDREERDCLIVDANWEKKLDFVTMSPVKDIINAADKAIDTSIYKIINSIIKKNDTTLVFTNTRSGTERVVYNLMRRFRYGEEHIAAHHGSLSREIRLGVEELMKRGKLRCVVSSTSLELGIDIGYIDNVVQLGSPKSVTRAIQRIGRSGHKFNDVARGEIVVVNRDDLVECAVMLDAAKRRHLDSFSTPKNALDVLAQHIVGMALTKKWAVDEAFSTVRKAAPYHTLQKRDFVNLLEYLSGAYVGLESRRVYGKIWYDAKEQTLGRRGRLTKLIYYLNIGTIPDEVGIQVYTTDRRWIGSIEEEFLARMKPGDVFVLGGRLYRFEYSKGMSAFVNRAESRMPTIPPWFSEQLPLSYELALEIGRFRERFSEALAKELVKGRNILSKQVRERLYKKSEARKILDGMPMDENAKRSIFEYFVEQLLFAKYVPNDHFILIERTQDREKNYVVFHSLYGRKVNDALSRIFAIMLSEIYEVDMGVIVNDNGFVIFTDRDTKISREKIDGVFAQLEETDVTELLKQNIRRTEMMKRRFRHSAVRGFMVLRNYKGKRISVRRQQINSQLLLTAAEEISSDFPIVKETYREILDDVMDLPRTKEVLGRLGKGETEYRIIDTPIPSPFSHIMLTFGEADIVMMKDRRKHLRELHRQVLKRIKARK